MTDTPPVPPAGSTPPAAPNAPQPGYAAPAYPPQAYGPPNNTLAIVAMVLSLAGIVTGITAIVGAILGHVALGQINRTGEGGRGFALTGIIAGWVITGLGLLFLIAYIGFVFWIVSTYGTTGLR